MHLIVHLMSMIPDDLGGMNSHEIGGNMRQTTYSGTPLMDLGSSARRAYGFESRFAHPTPIRDRTR